MRLEVLVPTMYCKNAGALYKKMNIQSDAIIVNQCDVTDEVVRTENGKRVLFISEKSRGASVSRNLLMRRSSADILIFGDDDLRYEDNYEKTINRAYKRFPDADIILFDVPSLSADRPTFKLNKTKVLSFREIVRFAAFQFTLRRTVIEKNITFNKLFGPGNKAYSSTVGEDMLFLVDAYKKKCRIVYFNEPIASVHHTNSTWHHKEFSPDFFFGEGALFAAISVWKAPAFILYYAIVKYPMYRKKMSFLGAVLKMSKGCLNYIRRKNK